jgi:hypothetical protein
MNYKTILLSLFYGTTAVAAPWSSHRMQGEVLPKFTNKNLISNGKFQNQLRGWQVIREAGTSKVEAKTIKGKSVLSIEPESNNTLAGIISAPINVESGKKYLLTVLYQTQNAKFGSYAQIKVVPEQKIKSFKRMIQSPQAYAFFGNKEVYNRRKDDWQRIVQTYTPPKGVSTVRIALLQYGTATKILYSSIYFAPFQQKLRKNDKNYYSDYDKEYPDAAKIISARKNTTAEIVKFGDASAISINGKTTPPLIYFGDAFTPKRSKLQDFQKAGIGLQILTLQRNRKYWRGPGDYDLNKIDTYLSEAIYRNPHGNFLINIDVSPYLNWHKDFPADSAQGADGKIFKGRHGRSGPPSYWSEKYRQEACKYLNAVVTFIKKKPYYKCIAGIFISGNEDGQFYYQGRGSALQDGHAPAAERMFRKWLKERYVTNSELRKAWNQKDVDFSNAKPPACDKRYKSTFLNPATQQREIDFVKFLNESMGDFVNRMCDTVKKAAGKPIITTMWWGRGASLLVYPHFCQSEKIFPSASLDLMGAQPGYRGERENGCSSFYSWVYDSARIHQKIAMLEADYRTWLSPYKSLLHDFHVVRYWNYYDLKGALLREFGKQMSIGGGMWWYDMSAGWFKDNQIMQLNKRIADIAKELFSSKIKITPAEIVLVADEQNYYTSTEQIGIWNGPNYHSIRLSQRAFLRAGLKYDFYYFKDIVDKKMDNYKVYIFLNAYYLSDKKRAFIEKYLKRNGKTLIWTYAPGYLTGKGFSVENMSRLTGIKLTESGKGGKLSQFVTGSSSLLKGIAKHTMGPGFDIYGVRFSVNDSKATPLARYTADRSISAAVKRMRGWNSIYIGSPSGFTPAFLQNIAQFAGIHVYNTPGDMFCYHRDDLICLHGVEGNENILQLPFKAKLIDMFDNSTLLNDGNLLKIKLQPGETRIIKVMKK